MKKKTQLFIYILFITTIKTSKSGENLQKQKTLNPDLKKLPDTKEAKSFCGKRIHVGIANDVQNRSTADLVQENINRYNSIVGKMKADFPLIEEPDHGFISLANKMIINPPQFTRIKTKYDFFTLYIYILKFRKNVKMIFTIKPHKNDIDKNIIAKFDDFNETGGDMYSYLYPSFEHMIEKTNLTAGFYSFERSYLYEDNHNFEVELCMNFYIYINKLTKIWRQHNDDLYNGRIEPVEIDEYDYVKESFGDEKAVKFLDFVSMIYDKNNNVCLQGEVITFFAMVDNLEQSNFEEEEDYSESTENYFDGLPEKGKSGNKRRVLGSKKEIVNKRRILGSFSDEKKKQAKLKNKDMINLNNLKIKERRGNPGFIENFNEKPNGVSNLNNKYNNEVKNNDMLNKFLGGDPDNQIKNFIPKKRYNDLSVDEEIINHNKNLLNFKNQKRQGRYNDLQNNVVDNRKIDDNDLPKNKRHQNENDFNFNQKKRFNFNQEQKASYEDIGNGSGDHINQKMNFPNHKNLQRDQNGNFIPQPPRGEKPKYYRNYRNYKNQNNHKNERLDDDKMNRIKKLLNARKDLVSPVSNKVDSNSAENFSSTEENNSIQFQNVKEKKKNKDYLNEKIIKNQENKQNYRNNEKGKHIVNEKGQRLYNKFPSSEDESNINANERKRGSYNANKMFHLKRNGVNNVNKFQRPDKPIPFLENYQVRRRIRDMLNFNIKNNYNRQNNFKVAEQENLNVAKNKRDVKEILDKDIKPNVEIKYKRAFSVDKNHDSTINKNKLNKNINRLKPFNADDIMNGVNKNGLIRYKTNFSDDNEGGINQKIRIHDKLGALTKDRRKKFANKENVNIIEKKKILQNVYDFLVAEKDRGYNYVNFVNMDNDETKKLGKYFEKMRDDLFTNISSKKNDQIMEIIILNDIKEENQKSIKNENLCLFGSLSLMAVTIEDLTIDDIETEESKSYKREKLEGVLNEVFNNDVLSGLSDDRTVTKIMSAPDKKAKIKKWFENIKIKNNLLSNSNKIPLSDDLLAGLETFVNSFGNRRLSKPQKTQIKNSVAHEINVFRPDIKEKRTKLKEISEMSGKDFLKFILVERSSYVRKSNFLIEFIKILVTNPILVKNINLLYENKKKEFLENTDVVEEKSRIEEEMSGLRLIIYNDLSVDTNWSFFHEAFLKMFFQNNFVYFKELMYKEEIYTNYKENGEEHGVMQEKINKTGDFEGEPVKNVKFADLKENEVLTEVEGGVVEKIVKGNLKVI